MTERTIVDAAVEVLKTSTVPLTAVEIHTSIIERQLYNFNTPVPVHVVRTTLERQTVGTNRKDFIEPFLFEKIGNGYRLIY